MKNKNILLIILVSIVIFISSCTNNVNSNVTPTGNIGSEVGDTAPDFEIIDVNGEKYSLSDFKGKPVIISFFATWCIPCQIESNNIKQVDDGSTGNDFVVFHIGVDARETTNELLTYKNNYGNKDWIFGFGFDVASLYNARTLDTTLIIDKEGTISYRDNGRPASVDILKERLL